jgi:tetratricopeptide (TPR) repeat protein
MLSAKRNWNDAIEIFDRIISQDAQSSKAHYYKALCLLGKGDFQVAKSALKRSLELNPTDVRAKLLQADVYLKERDFLNAEKVSREVLVALPENYQAHSVRAKALIGQSNLNQAKANIDQMVQIQPGNPQGLVLRGFVQRLQNNHDAALASFEAALALKDGQLDVLNHVVAIHIGRKDFAAALARCDQQLDLLQSSAFHQAYIKSLKGRLYMMQSMDREAEAAFQSALSDFPDFTQPYYGLAQIYVQRKETDKAVAQYQAMLEKNKDAPGPHMLLGVLYDTQKKFDLSEKHYREVLRVNPDFAPAANNLAFLLADRSENLDEALMLAQKAKEKLPQDPSVMDTLGWVYYKRGLYDSAIAELSDSAEKLPAHAGVHYHLGMAYYRKEKRDLAKEHLSRALRLDAGFDGAEEARRVLSEL